MACLERQIRTRRLTELALTVCRDGDAHRGRWGKLESVRYTAFRHVRRAEQAVRCALSEGAL